MTFAGAVEFPAFEEELAHAGAGAVEAGFDGADGGVHGVRDFTVGQALDIGQEDGLALFFGELLEGGEEGASGFGVEGGDFGRAAVVGRGPGVAVFIEHAVERGGGPPFASSEFVAAAVGGDAHEPGGEVAAAVAVERAPGGEHGVLGGVFGGGGGAEHAEAEAEDAALVASDE